MEFLDGHTGNIVTAAFRPEGQLVTAGTDGAVITWRLGDWSNDFRDWIRDHPGYDPPRDAGTLIYAKADGDLVGIKADPEIWRGRACDIAGRSLTEEEWAELFGGRAYEPACRDGETGLATSP